MKAKLWGSVAAAALMIGTCLYASAHQGVDPRLKKFILDKPETHIADKAGRIKKGRDLFLNETFSGNGRTCGTCHEPTRNFTIDQAFIATLPQSSPLFVAENNPDLADLEKPALMRQFGLILENLDGFQNPGVMRGVPHTLGLTTSIKPRADFPLVNATGWSGDGAPFDGSLLNFAVGAVVQHFTKDLLRRPNVDFRMPTKQELEAMRDFQVSLGRKTEISLDGVTSPALVFADPNVEAGKALFLNAPSRNGQGRSCNGCHNDAGANDANGANRQFDTGVAKRPDAPVCRDATAPGDGGFLFAPITTASRSAICGTEDAVVTFRGDGTFNTPPLIEAADSAPFFHNNAVNTIEEAVSHYTTDVFNASPSGGGNAFVLNGTQIAQISAMLRTVNAMENIRRGIDVDNLALKTGQPDLPQIIAEARSETLDAINVLNGANDPIYQTTTIIGLLQQAAVSEQAALSPPQKMQSLQTAIARKNEALSQFTSN
jgi:cytochrome c peroxidase